MEQLTLPFPKKSPTKFKVVISVDEKEVPSQDSPREFESREDGVQYLHDLKIALEDSPLNIQLDFRAGGDWVGLQKLSDGVHVWRGYVTTVSE